MLNSVILASLGNARRACYLRHSVEPPGMHLAIIRDLIMNKILSRYAAPEILESRKYLGPGSKHEPLSYMY